MTAQFVTTTYLEITARTELRAGRAPRVPCAVTRVEIPTPALNRFLYVAVGQSWAWNDRLEWDAARWREHVDRPELETWVAYVRGTPAGYFELEMQGDDVEIVYFGLLPEFIGLGLGGTLLTAAIERAFGVGAARAWVHTCSLDHPQALGNYVARGMRVYRTEVDRGSAVRRD